MTLFSSNGLCAWVHSIIEDMSRQQAFSFISNFITACPPWEALSPVCRSLCIDACVFAALLHITAISFGLTAMLSLLADTGRKPGVFK